MDSLSVALDKTARDTINCYHMCGQGDRIAVGVSGGGDSVALLAFLCSVRTELGIEILACHVNHRLRGEESDGDEEFVRTLAERLGVPFRLCTFDAAAEARGAGMGVEEYSRQRRYAFFEECAGTDGRIATAHTLSDAAETVLFNLLRGTGIKGLCGIPRLRGNIIRPLRDCTREQVEQYLGKIGQPYRTDSTNLSDDYSRNLLRHRVVPELCALNPAFYAAIGRTMEQMEQQWQMTAQLADTARQTIGAGEFRFRREGFLQLPIPVGNYLLQEWLSETGASQSEKKLGLMRKYAEAGSGGLEIIRGIRFAADQKYICIAREKPLLPPFSHELSLPKAGESTKIPLENGKTLKITCDYMRNNEITEKFYNIDLKKLVKCDKIKGQVFTHNPKPCDTIHLQGRSHSLITRYRAGSHGLCEGEISAMTAVEDDNGIIWAQGLGTDELRRAEDGTDLYYFFEVLEEKNHGLF